MKKKYYEAKASLRYLREAYTFEVVIYSRYKSIAEALEGARIFCSHGYDVVSIFINER